MTFRHVSDVYRDAYEKCRDTREAPTLDDDQELEDVRAMVKRLAQLLNEGRRSCHGDSVITALQALFETVDYQADRESYTDAISMAIWLLLQLRACLEAQSEIAEAQ